MIDFVCGIPSKGIPCIRVFDGEVSLLRHQKKQHGQGDFVCEVCDKRFAAKRSVKQHRDALHSPKVHVCVKTPENDHECGQSFGSLALLKTHRTNQAKEKRFICAECAHASDSAYHLRQHMNTHTGTREFVCHALKADGTECGDAFTNTGTLHNHGMVHKKEALFTCDFEKADGTPCGSTFARKHQLGYHSIVHKDQYPFRCEERFCGQLFKRKGELTKHTKRFHANNEQRRRTKTENALANVLAQNGIVVAPPECIDYGCVSGADTENGGLFDKKRVYIDFTIYKEHCAFIVECDEHQHNAKYSPWNYNVLCDMARMGHVQTSLTINATSNNMPVLPIVWIRFNPDKFFVNDVQRSRKITRPLRYQRLLEVIEDLEPPMQPLTIIYMFYDCVTVNGYLQPLILQDPDYDPHLAKCVLQPIVD